MTSPESGTAIEIWRRHVDLSRQERHKRLLVRWCLIPTVLLVVLAAVLLGPGEALGVLILVGSIAGLVAAWVLLSGRNVRAHPAVTLDGRDLCWAKRRVPVDQVQSFRTGSASETVIVNDVTSYAHYGYCEFALRDGSEVRFRWTDLPEGEVEGLRQALAQIFPGRDAAAF